MSAIISLPIQEAAQENLFLGLYPTKSSRSHRSKRIGKADMANGDGVFEIDKRVVMAQPAQDLLTCSRVQ